MGKGSGKLSTWYTHLHGGVFLVEFRNLRRGRALYFANQISFKLPILTKFTEFQTKTIKLNGGRSTNPRHSVLF